MEHFEDIGPSVVLASPGMMQSGLSRELFESWCTDKRNGCIIAGYCVEGTLAKVRPVWKAVGLFFWGGGGGKGALTKVEFMWWECELGQIGD